MLKSLKDFDVAEKRILTRCDFNVPLNKDGTVASDFKIRESLPTLQYLTANGAKTILISHLDNPDGTVTSTLDPVKEKLESLLNVKIEKTSDCVGEEAENETSKLNPGEILLLENVRFHKEEFDNDPEFSKKLSLLGDVYINDAFAVSHRSHASVIGIPAILPHGAGFLLMKEVESLRRILDNPPKPMIALIGGKNVQTKSKFIKSISRMADFVLVSGLIKKEMVEKKMELAYPEKIIGPAHNFDALDIDEKTIALFEEKIISAKTIIWNGPFGKFEDEKYKNGTLTIARAIIKSGAFSVTGGGETVEFLDKEGLTSQFSHVSTGGGAMLAYLAGENLPGLEALES